MWGTVTLLATHLGRARNTLSTQATRELLAGVQELPGAVQQVLDQEPTIKQATQTHADSEVFFYVDREAGYPVALESALKLKEISYNHAERSLRANSSTARSRS